MESKKFYIAYGSNLNKPQMAHRCPTARVLGASELSDWQLVFRGPRGASVATVEPKEESLVPILIWEITKEDELALDRYEGFPFFYRKESMEVLLNGKVVEAMIYIMNEGKPKGEPSCNYYSIIYEGYKAAGFDTNILRRALEKQERRYE